MELDYLVVSLLVYGSLWQWTVRVAAGAKDDRKTTQIDGTGLPRVCNVMALGPETDWKSCVTVPTAGCGLDKLTRNRAGAGRILARVCSDRFDVNPIVYPCRQLDQFKKNVLLKA